MPPRADAGGQIQARRPCAAADVQHVFAHGGRGGFDRGLAEHRHHGIEPGLVSDPALPALAFPVGYLINIFLCHAFVLVLIRNSLPGYPPAWLLPPCAAMNMATADRQ